MNRTSQVVSGERQQPQREFHQDPQRGGEGIHQPVNFEDIQKLCLGLKVRILLWKLLLGQCF